MLWSFTLAFIGILGIYLAGKNNKWGWALGIFAQVLWMVFAVVTHQYGFILSAIAYGWVYSLNFYKWATKENKEEEK